VTDDTWRRLPEGARVVVRRRLDAAEAQDARTAGRGAVWTDVIGIVLAVDEAGIRVRTDAPRDDPRELTIPGDAIEAAKQIPPRPTRRSTA
jgi:hypothetical protein